MGQVSLFCPPISYIPIVLSLIWVGYDIVHASTDGHDIDVCIEGNDVDLACQALEKLMVELDAVGKDDGVAGVGKGLVDEGVVDAGVVAEIGLGGGGNLG